jgi:peptide-methionine (R)-S-oxide reductase
MQFSDDEWKQKLTPEQFRVLREKGTEAPFSGRLLANTETGEYKCAACGTVIFKSNSKYESHNPGLMGWPSFSEVASSDKVNLAPDDSLGMQRTEVICKTCGSHLGHVFDDPESPSGKHYCINSCALDFNKR